MKLLYNGMEITCTPDEFEDLVIRGLLPGREKLININDDDDDNEWLKQFCKNVPKEVMKGPYLPPTVALYGCEMTQPIAVYGCPSVATGDPYIPPAYTSNVTISQEQLNKLNTIVNKDEQST